MNLIKNNLYRIAGLFVGTTAREQEKQIRRLKQLIESEQESQDDFSFSLRGNFTRSEA
jgi:hypothetical protein